MTAQTSAKVKPQASRKPCCSSMTPPKVVDVIQRITWETATRQPGKSLELGSGLGDCRNDSAFQQSVSRCVQQSLEQPEYDRMAPQPPDAGRGSAIAWQPAALRHSQGKPMRPLVT